jgi:N utilization substance protein B
VAARSGSKPRGGGGGPAGPRPTAKRDETGPRRLAREAALQILFALDESGAEDAAAVTHAIQTYWAHLEGPAAGREYADEIVRAVMPQRDALDQFIRDANPNWRIERMARVDRNILRIAVHEFVHGSVPANVAIDEAVELAKRFGGEESPAFVNGTLDKIARNHKKL